MARITKDEYYLGIALAVSKRSTCIKRHYGCVIVKDDIIIATGYNGSPRGEENCCDRGTCKRANAERYSGYESCDSVHAEQNALIATSRERLIGATVYLACEEYGLDKAKSDLWDEEVIGYYEDMNPVPCGICARMLKNAGHLQCRRQGLTPGSGRSPGEGNGNPLQHFCLGNPWTEDPGGLQSTGSQRVGHD